MKKFVCEMCECNDFAKVDGFFVCQGCGCKYTPEDAKQLMREFPDDSPAPSATPAAEPTPIAPQPEPEPEYPPQPADSPNRIRVRVNKVGHETYTMNSVSSLSVLFGDEPQPEFVDGPDMVGHIGAAITIEHLAGKAIKYITVFLTPYNAVGDPVSCTVAHYSTFGINVTGPLVAGETWNGYSDGMWYNNSITSAKIDHATVEYMDGSKELICAKDLITPPSIKQPDAPKPSPTNSSAPHSSASDKCVVTVSFTASPGAARELWYTFDGGPKYTLKKDNVRSHTLTTGFHTLYIKNPFLKTEQGFRLSDSRTIHVRTNAFNVDISFE